MKEKDRKNILFSHLFFLLLHKIKLKMLKFISFGSGSSGNCYLLYSATDGLLIDSGLGTRILKKRLKDYGLTLSSVVSNILITHDHADHVKSVGCVSHDNNLPVYATQQVHNGIKRNYCVRHKVDDSLIRLIEKGKEIELGEFKVTPFEVPHDSSDNVGYKIVWQDIVFCIITDAGHVTSEMQTYISQANYLVIEANHSEEMLLGGPYPQYLKERILGPNGHLSNTACAEALAKNATSKLHHVWLCHLSEENNHPELARKTVEETLHTNGIIIGTNFKLDVLKRKSPSEIFELT